jgi:hypothetical protein
VCWLIAAVFFIFSMGLRWLIFGNYVVAADVFIFKDKPGALLVVAYALVFAPIIRCGFKRICARGK